MKAPIAVLAAALLLPAAAFADDDAEGCKDAPMISRMAGSVIHSCENKEYEQFEFNVGTDKEGNVLTKKLEGRYQSWDYGTREGTSEIQVYRNFQNALKRGGFAIDYAQEPNLLTAHKGDTWVNLDNKGSFYYQTILKVEAMQQEIAVDADALAQEIKKSGHVAVYGIQFDTAKATIKPESESTLGEIVKLLQADPSLKLRIEGHTDNVGQAAANQALSEKRAASVVAWLTQHGIAGTRLTAKGLGASKPIADNATDEGRAKNRRVELVKG